MFEGWYEEDYFVMFASQEAALATEEYRAADFVPDYSIVGMRGWDDLLLSNPAGETFACPSVPLQREALGPARLPAVDTLRADARFVGKVKWYVQPIVFGGEPIDEANIRWVSHEEHRRLVAWWNEKYRAMKRELAGEKRNEPKLFS